MKRVLQINITCQHGSTGKIVESIHNHLLKNRFESYVAYSAYDSNIKDAFKIESEFENFLRRGLNRLFGRKQSHSTLGTMRLIKNIKQINPDLIHIHNIQQNSVNFIRLFQFLKSYNRPVIYTLHDCWAFTGGCYHFTEIKCDKYQAGCQNCPLPRDKLDTQNRNASELYKLKESALRSLDHLEVVCVSHWLKAAASRSYMKNIPLSVINNGIDINVFKPITGSIKKKLGIENKFIILGAANYWDERKGLRDFKELSKKIDHKIVILLIGLNDDQREDLPKNIIGISRTENKQELVELYSAADIFINCSTEETFGMVTAEAMACGTPAIVYDSTACPEIVDLNTGFIIKPHDINSINQAIQAVMEKGKGYYSDHCRTRIIENFLNEMMTENYLQLYRKLI